MHKRFTSAALLAAIVVASFAASVRADGDDANAHEDTAHIQFLGGIKALGDNDWKPADEQTGFGVQFDINPENKWPFHALVGFKASESKSEETEVATIGRVTSESQTTEMLVGVRRYIDADRLQPYIGAGLVIVRAELDTTTPAGNNSDTGTGVGPWVGLGALYMISDWLGLGAQVQYSQAETEIFGEDLNAGGIHADLVLSFGF